MKRIDSISRWTEAALDTPFEPKQAPTPTFYPPGVCVKSRERAGNGKFFGRVVEFDNTKNYALIRSYGSRFDVHGSPGEAGVLWEGTITECLSMWEVD